MKSFFLSEKNIMIAIAINSIIIYALYFPQLNISHHNIYLLLDSIDHLFAAFFIVEAIVKIRTLGAKEYFKSSWNIFDFTIAVLSIPSMLNFIPFFARFNFSFLKILRLFRILKLLRLVTFFPRMNSILSGLGRALKSSVFVLIALLFLNFIIALFTTHFYGKIAPDRFGDPLISSYQIFKLFTIEGWYEIPEEIAGSKAITESVHSGLLIAASKFYFIVVVLLGGIFGMSLANAIFVDEMTIDNNADLENKIDVLIEKINDLETKIDSNA